MNTTTTRTMFISTSAAHVLAVGRRYGLGCRIDGDYIVCRRNLGDLGELEYRAPLTFGGAA